MKSVELKGLTSGIECKDNICLLKNQYIVKIVNILEDEGKFFLNVRYLEECHPLFQSPCDSRKYGICVADITKCGQIKQISISEVMRKMLKIPMLEKKIIQMLIVVGKILLWFLYYIMMMKGKYGSVIVMVQVL